MALFVDYKIHIATFSSHQFQTAVGEVLPVQSDTHSNPGLENGERTG
jgi:hypothetical protein